MLDKIKTIIENNDQFPFQIIISNLKNVPNVERHLKKPLKTPQDNRNRLLRHRLQQQQQNIKKRA